MLHRILHAISGIILGLTPMVAAAVFGLLALDGLALIYAIPICVVLGAIAIFIGVGIFIMVYREGLIGFISRMMATSQMDNLEPVAGDGVRKLSAAEYAELVTNHSAWCAGGAMQIFEDWFDRSYQGYHEVESASYDADSDLLTLQFKGPQVLKVHQPGTILEAKSFFKILTANKVEFEWMGKDKKTGVENLCRFHYEVVGRKVVASGSQHAHKSRFHTSLGAPAVMIYGKFQ